MNLTPAERTARYRATHPGKVRAGINKWRSENKDKVTAHRLKNRDKYLSATQAWRSRNREVTREQARVWARNNRERIKVRRNARLKSDPNFKLSTYYRNRMRAVLRGGPKKQQQSLDLLGCTVEFFKGYV